MDLTEQLTIYMGINMYREDSSPWGFLINMAIALGLYHWGYKQGQYDTAHSIEHNLLRDEISELREALRRQNEINELNRLKFSDIKRNTA
jgi:nitrogen fixation-related uncharacterized protein